MWSHHYPDRARWFAGKPSSTIPRYVGIEIEVPSPPDFHQATFFTKVSEYSMEYGGEVKCDGTIPTTGREITTAPARGTVAVERIKELSQILTGVPEYHYECGVHIHVDVRDLGLNHYDFTDAWFEIREDFWTLIPEWRRNHEWCCEESAISGWEFETVEVRVFPSVVNELSLLTYASVCSNWVALIAQSGDYPRKLADIPLTRTIRRNVERIQATMRDRPPVKWGEGDSDW